MKNGMWLIVFYCFFSKLTAQEFIISGTVLDQDAGETIIGAAVTVVGTTLGTVTNEYGKYILTVPKSGQIIIKCTSIGYLSKFDTVIASSSLKNNIYLKPESRVLEEVTIKADHLKDRITSTQMGLEEITTKTSKILPALFGEVDIIKTLQLKAGVSSGSEGSSGIFVRGGSNDQNLILLDEAVVYNSNHLFGFFSTFNSDAIKDVKLFKGGFPAQYGGRLSSVIDIRMKDGNNQKFSGTGGIGLISSRLTLEGPIQKGKSSYIISGRRTYIDLITNQINNANKDNAGKQQIPAYNFYDLNAKVNTSLGENDRLYLSGYFGKDNFAFKDSAFNLGFNWGNATGTVRWNHTFNPKLFLNTSFIYSNYDYNISNEITGFSFNVGSGIANYTGKLDFTYNPFGSHQIRMGLHVTNYKFDVGRLKAGSDDGEIAFSAGSSKKGNENALYFNDEFTVIKGLKLNIGARLVNWNATEKKYFGFEPRISSNFQINNRFSFKLGYARMNQNIHLVSSSGVSLPTDVWYPTTKLVKPEKSDQTSIGFTYLLAPGFLLTNEYYYKWILNQVDFRDNANLFLNDNLETEFEFGKGKAYGTEISLEKNLGVVTGWVAYTLSYVNKSEFPGIMDGRQFSPRHDRRHDLKFVISYQISKCWTISGTWVYGSGDLAWLPQGRYFYQDIPGSTSTPVTPIYGDRNTFRLPPYHRADLGIVYTMFPKWGESDLTISVYNLYDRRNPYFLTLETISKEIKIGEGTIEIPEKISAKQISLFPILPSITYNFKF